MQTSFWLYRHYSNPVVDSIILDEATQSKIDELKRQNAVKDSIKIYPFNPNYISDYKGYMLGMSVAEIDRLHQFRAKNEFVNSKEEFQEVTQVSDSLLKVISPFFRFPSWTQNRTQNPIKKKNDSKEWPKESVERDLNKVTANELKTINGIGEILSARIVKFRDRLGGFLLDDQLNDVYGLEPDVAKSVLKKYKVLNAPFVQKIPLNTASAEELSGIVYLNKTVAKKIVEYRQQNGGIQSFDELTKIEDFPTNRIDRIPLYLSLKK